MSKISILDFFKKKSTGTEGNPNTTINVTYAPTQDGRTPFYSSFGSSIYASDIIVEAIRCKANEFMKLDPRHIVEKDGKQIEKRDSSVSRILRRPNDYMTTSDFLQKIAILLELNKNVFIYPAYEETGRGRRYTAFYPLKPSAVTYLIDKSKRFFIQFQFQTGYKITLPKEDVIHWRKDYFDDYFGGSTSWNQNKGLLTFLEEYNKLLQSIAKAVEVSCQIKGILQIPSYVSPALESVRDDFVERVKNSKEGIIPTDLNAQFTPMKNEVKLVDSDTLKFYYENICRNVGVSIPILNGTATKQEKQAFYEHSLEPYIISLSQAMTECLFSETERNFGNKISLYPSAIEFMSISDKIAYINALSPGGGLTRNEMRLFGGLPPLPEGMGGDEIPRGYNNLDNATDNASDNSDDEEGDNTNAE